MFTLNKASLRNQNGCKNPFPGNFRKIFFSNHMIKCSCVLCMMGGMWSWTMLPRLIEEEVVRYLRLHSTDAKESSIKMWYRIIKIYCKTLPPSGSFVSSKIISISSSDALRLCNLKKSALLSFKKCIITKIDHFTLRSQNIIF